jgi:ABC-type spermidine/putrescine transport system permease subunit II
LYGIGAEASHPVCQLLHAYVVPSVPVAIALVQVWRQTLLGWFLLVAGFTVVALALSYLSIEDQVLDRWPHGPDDRDPC